MAPKDVVLSFWQAMQTNDFVEASRWLSEDFECVWPQSRELIRGRSNFAAINTAYPAQGPWRFLVNTIVCEGNRVVTDVEVTDGHSHARAITFHCVENGLIRSQTEFWPDRYDPPE